MSSCCVINVFFLILTFSYFYLCCYSNAESVRDVQFNPHQQHTFAAVTENGTVQLWDLRKHDKCNKQFTGHSGPIFTCDWHPEVKTWLATAGRDRAVKVCILVFSIFIEI